MSAAQILIIIPLILLLVIPVSTLAKATNESSYLYGQTQGRLNWKDCTTLADKDGNYPTCDGPSLVVI